MVNTRKQFEDQFEAMSQCATTMENVCQLSQANEKKTRAAYESADLSARLYEVRTQMGTRKESINSIIAQVDRVP
jgi:hypothetical protein